MYSSNRNGFILAPAILIGVPILLLIVTISIMGSITDTIVPILSDVITDVPTLYEYDENGKRITGLDGNGFTADQRNAKIAELESKIESQQSVIDSTKNDRNRYNALNTNSNTLQVSEDELERVVRLGKVNQNLKIVFYWIFGIAAITFMSFKLVFACATHFYEKSFSFIPRGMSGLIIKNSILGIAIIFLIPEFWDFYALNMEKLALYIMDPFTGEPQQVIVDLWNIMRPDFDFSKALNPIEWGYALAFPETKGQDMIKGVILPVFSTIPITLLTLGFLMIAKARSMFIAIILTSLPVWLACLNLPIVGDLSHKMLKYMVAATIAPFFSALVLGVGLVVITSHAGVNSILTWVECVIVISLSAGMVLMLSPIISSLASQVTGITQSTTQAGTSSATSSVGTGANVVKSVAKKR